MSSLGHLLGTDAHNDDRQGQRPRKLAVVQGYQLRGKGSASANQESLEPIHLYRQGRQPVLVVPLLVCQIHENCDCITNRGVASPACYNRRKRYYVVNSCF